MLRAKEFDPAKLAVSIPFMAAAKITQREPNTLGGIVDRGGPVRLSFFGVPGLPRAYRARQRIADRIPAGLAGTKANVVQLGAEAKDYRDLDAILRDGRIDLSTALASAQALYGPQFNPQIVRKALSFFDEGNLRRLSKATKDHLAKAVREVDLDRLPTIVRPVQPGGTGNGPSQ